MKLVLKSQLQLRAENAAKIFDSARKPIVFEFAGVPKAGKTSTIAALQSFLKRCGFRVEVVVEKASVCPIRDKQHFNFNVWTACTTLSQLLEKTQIPPNDGDPDILILDRGLFDTVCWLGLMEKLKRIRTRDREVLESFILTDDWRKRISAVFVMTVNPNDAMKREKGLLPVKGAKGSIMNLQVLQEMVETTNETSEKLKGQFRIFPISTSDITHSEPQRKVAETVAARALDIIEEHLREDILTVTRKEFNSHFGRSFLNSSTARKLVTYCQEVGSFKPRHDVENNNAVIQPLPIVIIRRKNGEVLRLKRKEKNPRNLLNEKKVIWAGGHIRKEDADTGSPILNCAARELQEELRLSVETNDLQLKGAIYYDENPSSAKHLAIVYEWQAKTDDVAIALSSAEFFEKRGNSVSGTFVPISSLVSEVNEGSLNEEWSVQIIRNILAPQSAYERNLL